VARPSLQSRKLILETSFAVKKDFSKFEATSWAVQELKPVTKPHVADEEEAEMEQVETITLRASDFEALQDTLEDIRFQIADIQRDVRQDQA
jgi:hypothetical protein